MFEFATSLNSEVNEKFAEKRLLERYEYLMEMMADSQSCILNQMSRCRKERKAGYDFFKNEEVAMLDSTNSIEHKINEMNKVLLIVIFFKIIHFHYCV